MPDYHFISDEPQTVRAHVGHPSINKYINKQKQPAVCISAAVEIELDNKLLHFSGCFVQGIDWYNSLQFP